MWLTGFMGTANLVHIAVSHEVGHLSHDALDIVGNGLHKYRTFGCCDSVWFLLFTLTGIVLSLDTRKNRTPTECCS